MKKIILSFLLLSFISSVRAEEPVSAWTSKELARFPAAEANQGVAVDDEFFYAIDNRRIGKYRKSDGYRVDGWQDVKDGEFIHLNAGVVGDGRLFCAHSNFPGKPMLSSIEIWDADSMKHIMSRSLGIGPGSLTWFAGKENGDYFACFVHYAEKGKDGQVVHLPSQIVSYDNRFRPTGGAWVFPKELAKKFGTHSASCGAFGPGGYLYVTGHDEPELYVLDFPKAGSVLRWIATVPVTFQGQAFAWDLSRDSAGDRYVVYGIIRKSKTVVVNEIVVGVVSDR